MQQPRAIELLEFLLPRLASGKVSIPKWPPDVFALMAILLQRSRAYSFALTNWPPSRHAPFAPKSSESRSSPNYQDEVAKLARAWARRGTPPALVRECWKDILESCRRVSLDELQSANPTAISDSLLLLAIADEAAFEFGLLPHSSHSASASAYAKSIGKILEFEFGDARSLCEEIALDRAVVLPKKRTPQNGLTIRSFSHHLAAIECPEARIRITSRTIQRENPQLDHAMNIVLCPWPDRMQPRSILPAKPPKRYLDNMPVQDFGFFTLKPPNTLASDLGQYVLNTIREAESLVGRVDGLVFPECSMSTEQFDAITSTVKNDKSLNPKFAGFILAGLFEEPAAITHLPSTGKNKEYPKNFARFWTPDQAPLDQHKHHRWLLDAQQIRQYQLGSALDPEKSWWELIELGSRDVQIINLFPWMTMVPLICEDLARPDPVATTIRAVGPDLVIALLMDGPQLLRRWSSRSAASLCDDPGSAVLTLTSLALINQSNLSHTTANRVVAMFKDKLSGDHEIHLPTGATSVILTLTRKSCVEWSADGRKDDSASASHPVLSGIHYGYAAFPKVDD